MKFISAINVNPAITPNFQQITLTKEAVFQELNMDTGKGDE